MEGHPGWLSSSRRLLTRLTAGISVVLTCLGCGSPQAKVPALAVSLTISGGIAGTHQRIEITDAGAVHVTADRDGYRSSARPLNDAEQRDLDDLLSAVDFDELPKRSVNDRGRDMLEYRLQYEGHTLVTDRSTSLGAADHLIDLLRGWLRERT